MFSIVKKKILKKLIEFNLVLEILECIIVSKMHMLLVVSTHENIIGIDVNTIFL